MRARDRVSDFHTWRILSNPKVVHYPTGNREQSVRDERGLTKMAPSGWRVDVGLPDWRPSVAASGNSKRDASKVKPLESLSATDLSHVLIQPHAGRAHEHLD